MEYFQRCRICISESAVMMSIFGEDALWKKITYFADVQIEEGDNLPQQICVMCAKNAIKACFFKEECEKADRFFRKQLEKIQCDIISLSSTDGIEDDQNQMEDEDSTTEVSACNGQQCFKQQQEIIDHDNIKLPLIPVVELITSNEDNNKKACNGYQCTICFHFFAMKSILKHHIKAQHPDANPIYECFECKKVYLSKRFLDKHIRRGRCVKKRKNRRRVTQCADCCTSFPTGHHLGWHKRAGNCPRRSNFKPLPIELEECFSDACNLDKSSTTKKESSLNLKSDRRWGNAKHKGRSRIKLHQDKIELAKKLVEQEASTTKLAKQLQISRTYAWKLRKSLLYFNSRKDDFNQSQAESNKIQNNNSCTLPNPLQGKTRNAANKVQTINQRKTYNAELTKLHKSNPLNNENENRDQNKQDLNNDNGEETESADECSQDKRSARKIKMQQMHRHIFTNDGIQDAQTSKYSVADNANLINNNVTTDSTETYKRKSRKPKVFMTLEKYEEAKKMVGQRATTMEIARKLNISQVSAWKLRDNILKDIPMTFKSPSIYRSKGIIPKEIIPRTKLYRLDRVAREKKIMEEILDMIKEDNTIQYWRVSEKLADKGLHLSTSSVCQKLRAMGFHRRSRSQNNTLKSSTTTEEENENSDLRGTI